MTMYLRAMHVRVIYLRAVYVAVMNVMVWRVRVRHGDLWHNQRIFIDCIRCKLNIMSMDEIVFRHLRRNF
jgi:hypothetical protein